MYSLSIQQVSGEIEVGGRDSNAKGYKRVKRGQNGTDIASDFKSERSDGSKSEEK